MTPKPLRNDCFALPPGIEWTPVDEALSRLRNGLHPVVGVETHAIADAAGRVLAAPVSALRAHPPAANSAVDGYGFAHASLAAGPHRLTLVGGRAAAGQPFDGTVPPGHALRILTGAVLPAGVDTVVLEEDCEILGEAVSFGRGLKRGANTRPEGEDVGQGAPLLPAGRRLTAGDLALLASTGVARIEIFRRLRVGVLSTGDEVVQTGAPAGPGGIFDANRPMLMAILAAWGHQVVDLGHVPDDPARLRAALDLGADAADAILTTGGASAGDEDHVSRLLRTEGRLEAWRIAIKPGRPLALALWRGVPVFGLPGNPVAAFTCALVFARPALSRLAGAGWLEAEGFPLVAAFSKSKKAGRSEYLRARRSGDRVEVFRSEGSGRVSGLSWADGFVYLPPEAMEIGEGDRVTYIPFAEYGL